MLSLPQGNLKRTAEVVGIDPGSESLGLAIISFDIETLQIVSTQARTFVASKMFKDDTWLAQIHGQRVCRIKHLQETLIEIFNSVDPLFIACESPFYNPRRPNAYGVLVEVLDAIRNAVMEHDSWKSLYLIDPPTVKKSVGAPGNADKIKMYEIICSMDNLNPLNDLDLSSLDEHSIDAIAVAYCKYKTILLQ